MSEYRADLNALFFSVRCSSRNICEIKCCGWTLAGGHAAINLFDLENWTTEGSKFAAFDRLADARGHQPSRVDSPGCRTRCGSSPFAGHNKRLYELGSWVVMSIHVHMLLQSRFDLDPQLD
jgi:hypothetical protein